MNLGKWQDAVRECVMLFVMRLSFRRLAFVKEAYGENDLVYQWAA